MVAFLATKNSRARYISTSVVIFLIDISRAELIDVSKFQLNEFVSSNLAFHPADITTLYTHRNSFLTPLHSETISFIPSPLV